MGFGREDQQDYSNGVKPYTLASADVGMAESTARKACAQVMTPGVRFMHTTSALGPFFVEAG